MPLGQRQVVDLAAEVALHLVEPLFNQTLDVISPSTGTGVTVTLVYDPFSPLLPPTEYLYPGAQVVIGWHLSDAEVVTVIEVLDDASFTANVVNVHGGLETVFGATFPTQQPTDPIFTQAEIQGYIAQAQNEFLTKVPLIFEFFENLPVLVGQTFQTVPDTAIEMERVALQTIPQQNFFPLISISRTGGTVTAVVATSTSRDSWTPGLPILVYGVSDSSFDSASNSTFDLETVSPDGRTLTWAQDLADSSASDGVLARPIWTRLYESSQNQIAMQNPAYLSNLTAKPPTNWWEDRAGVYGWGLFPTPQGNFYVELLTSVRGPEFLGLLDSLLVPDVFAYPILWKTCEYCWTKDGVQRSPTMARFAGAKFDYWVMLADRFLRAIVEKIGSGK